MNKIFSNKTHINDSLLKIKSQFFPDKNNDSKINIFFEKLWNINLKEKKLQKKKEKKKKERQTFKKIQESKNTNIKDADNENAVVILNIKKYYRTKNLRNTKE